jgi:hypothetical protein
VRNNNILLPASMNYTISQMPKMNSLAAELATGQITYGEHNRRAVQLAVDTDSTSNKMAAEQRLIEAAAAAAGSTPAVTSTVIVTRSKRR